MVRRDLHIPKLVTQDDLAPGNVRLKPQSYYRHTLDQDKPFPST